MTEQFDNALDTHTGGISVPVRLQPVIAWIRHDFVWWLLIVPVLSSTLVYNASQRDILGWSESAVFKQLMEIVHPGFLAAFFVVSWFRWTATRNTAFVFLGTLSLFVLSREIVGQGSSFILYIGLIGLIVYASRKGEKLSALFPSKWAASFLFMCFVCYAASQLLDRGIVKRIGWLILWDTSWKPPHASNLEEALESLGGLFLLLSPFAVKSSANRTRPEEVI